MRMSNLADKVFTIVNQIPENSGTAAKATWKIHRLERCGKDSGIYDASSGTMSYRGNTWTAYIYGWERYKRPDWLDGGYYALSDDEQDTYFTANVGDLLIFSEISDAAPTTLQEFNALVNKYKDLGGTITKADAYIRFKTDGTPWKTNHIELIKG